MVAPWEFSGVRVFSARLEKAGESEAKLPMPLELGQKMLNILDHLTTSNVLSLGY